MTNFCNMTYTERLSLSTKELSQHMLSVNSIAESSLKDAPVLPWKGSEYYGKDEEWQAVVDAYEAELKVWLDSLNSKISYAFGEEYEEATNKAFEGVNEMAAVAYKESLLEHHADSIHLEQLEEAPLEDQFSKSLKDLKKEYKTKGKDLYSLTLKETTKAAMKESIRTNPLNALFVPLEVLF